MILTKETYAIHVACALIAIPVLMVSYASKPRSRRQASKANVELRRSGNGPRCGAAAIVVFYSGTFLNWNGVKGLLSSVQGLDRDRRRRSRP